MSKPTHIPVLDHLRGLAALSVCLFHFSNGNVDLLSESDPLRQFGSVGWLGVEAFFVISGFVIPYSLCLRSYRLSDSVDFFVRRLKRLEPPYLACIVFVVALQFLSSITPGFLGKPFAIGLPQLLAHFAYLNAILEYGWLNPVFWTLAIEFQFYIFMAFAFPLLNHSNPKISAAAIVCTASLGMLGLGKSSLLIHWLPLFAIGVASCQYYVGRLKLFAFLVVFCIAIWLAYSVIGIREAAVGGLTAATILAFGAKTLPSYLTPLALAGTLSYSLYLVHIPVGGRVINLATRLPDSWVFRYPAIFIAFILSVLAAYILWRLVEKPSQTWSKNSLKRVRKRVESIGENAMVSPTQRSQLN